MIVFVQYALCTIFECEHGSNVQAQRPVFGFFCKNVTYKYNGFSKLIMEANFWLMLAFIENRCFCIESIDANYIILA